MKVSDPLNARSRYRLWLSCAALILCVFVGILVHPLYLFIFVEGTPNVGRPIPAKVLALLLPMLVLAFPFVLWRAELARRAILDSPPVGRCAKCGYDMRATPFRCPECGTVVTLSPDDG